MNEIVVATGNKNKLAELRTIGDEFGLALLSPAEARTNFSLSPVPDPEETGSTFLANARIKAEAFSAWSGLIALGDDSGIEIDALDGRPGIYSARYAGPGANDAARISKLLSEVAEATEKNPALDRRGRFRCALVLYRPDGTIIEAEGTLEGKVLNEPAGNGGFGYDPILWIDELGQTLAETDFAVTCKRGFRAKAAMQLFSKICG